MLKIFKLKNMNKKQLLTFLIISVVSATSLIFAGQVFAAQETHVFGNPDVAEYDTSISHLVGYCANNTTATAYCKKQGYDGYTTYNPRYIGPTLHNDRMYVWNGSSFNIVDGYGCSYVLSPITCYKNTCTANAAKQCSGNAVYWYDSCGVKGSLFQQCTSTQTCQNAQCLNITCSNSSQCGTNGYTGSPFCQSGNVYQNYITYTCNNPGTANSSCSNNTTAQLKTTCTGNQTCSNGSCVNQNITCSSNTDCGSNAYTGSLFCQGNNVYQNYITYTCNNPGTANSSCSNNTAAQLKTTCTGNQTCNNGSCGTSCATHSYQQCQGNNLYWYNSCGQQEDSQYCPNGCSNNQCRAQQNANLTINQTVRNLTTGSGFASSTSASPGDTLMFMITLQTTGADAQNVLVRDNLPSTLIYQNQLVVACAVNYSYSNNNGNVNYNTNYCNGNNYNYSGNITSGVNLNTINAGQTITITYQAQVASASNFAYGTTTLNNSVVVNSSNAGYVPTNNASIIVNRAGVYGASTVSTGLTNNFWVDSFLLPIIITLIGLWMWRSGFFFGVERWLDNKKKVRSTYRSEKELSRKIAAIKSSGN